MRTKEEWKAVKAELDALEKEMDEAVSAARVPFEARKDEIEARLEEIEEDCPEIIGRCEGCSEQIWKGDRYSYDSNNGLQFCEPCSPSYADMLADPTSFYGADEEYLTAEEAKEIVDAHLAAGGSLDDKMVSA